MAGQRIVEGAKMEKAEVVRTAEVRAKRGIPRSTRMAWSTAVDKIAQLYVDHHAKQLALDLRDPKEDWKFHEAAGYCHGLAAVMGILSRVAQDMGKDFPPLSELWARVAMTPPHGAVSEPLVDDSWLEAAYEDRTAPAEGYTE